jgi:hypothetical protein
MEPRHAPDAIVALYDTLADVQAAMDELEGAGVPYPDIRMGAHTADDRALPDLGAAALPERFWSLSVLIDQRGRYHAEDILRGHRSFAVGRMPATHKGRSDTDLGAIAWRHYVFETPVATDHVGDSAGTTGNTGVISSGVYAAGALAEGNRPVRGRPGSANRPPSEAQKPTGDEQTRAVGEGAREGTEPRD